MPLVNRLLMGELTPEETRVNRLFQTILSNPVCTEQIGPQATSSEGQPFQPVAFWGGRPVSQNFRDMVDLGTNVAMGFVGTSGGAPAAKMPLLYHGTNEGRLSMHGPEMSLTPDRTQASGYARNYHRTDEYGDVLDEPLSPVVHEIQANPGQVLDVSGEIRRYESGKGGTNADAFIAKLAEDARKRGYRYLQFDHPNMPLPGADPKGSHQVVISLHPTEDLGYSLRVMEEEEAKRRKLQGR